MHRFIVFCLSLVITGVAFASIDEQFREQSSPHHRDKRVVGGQNAPENAYPWYVLVTRWKERHWRSQTTFENTLTGGASLINEKWVLVNAGVPEYEDEHLRWIVILGLNRFPKKVIDLDRRVELFKAEKIISHEKHNITTYVFDVALMKLGERLTVVDGKLVDDDSNAKLVFSKFIQPVSLPCPSARRAKIANEDLEFAKECSAESRHLHQPGSKVLVMGHGHTKIDDRRDSSEPSQGLQQAFLTLLSDHECMRDLPTLHKEQVPELNYTNEMICARSNGGGSDCIGDGGSPVMQKAKNPVNGKEMWIQIGIVSWGLGCPGEEIRDGRKIILPNYYAKVAAVMEWIVDRTGGYNPCPDFILPEHTISKLRKGLKLHDFTYSIGTQIDFECEDGYKAFGTPNPMVCLRNGMWSGSTPICFERFCKHDPSKLEEGQTCRANCTNYGDCSKVYEWCLCDGNCGRTCYDPGTRCPALEPPQNGHIESGTGIVGSVTTYSCDGGYFLWGSSERRCLSNGEWSGKTPRCSNEPNTECGRAGDVRIRPSKVIGGTDAAVAAWPWQVAIYQNGFNVRGTLSVVMAGGSVVNKKWILTAAHVFDKLDGIFLVPERYQNWERYLLVGLGITERPFSQTTIKEGMLFYEVSKIYRHNSYKARAELDYDIAMLQVGHRLISSRGIFIVDTDTEAGTIPYSEYIRPVCLPCISTCLRKKYACAKLGSNLLRESQTREFAEVVVTGFSIIGNLGLWLQQGLLAITEEATCQRGATEMSQIADIEDLSFTDRMICAQSKIKSNKTDACVGDSGGPLVRRVRNEDGSSCWIQIGIVSWGDACAYVQRGSNIPGYYTNVHYFVNWMKKTMAISD